MTGLFDRLAARAVGDDTVTVARRVAHFENGPPATTRADWGDGGSWGEGADLIDTSVPDGVVPRPRRLGDARGPWPASTSRTDGRESRCAPGAAGDRPPVAHPVIGAAERTPATPDAAPPRRSAPRDAPSHPVEATLDPTQHAEPAPSSLRRERVPARPAPSEPDRHDSTTIGERGTPWPGELADPAERRARSAPDGWPVDARQGLEPAAGDAQKAVRPPEALRPTVSVTIGRIEVVAAARAAVAAPTRPARPPAPRIPLDAYLEGRR